MAGERSQERAFLQKQQRLRVCLWPLEGGEVRHQRKICIISFFPSHFFLKQIEAYSNSCVVTKKTEEERISVPQSNAIEMPKEGFFF